MILHVHSLQKLHKYIEKASRPAELGCLLAKEWSKGDLGGKSCKMVVKLSIRLG